MQIQRPQHENQQAARDHRNRADDGQRRGGTRASLRRGGVPDAGDGHGLRQLLHDALQEDDAEGAREDEVGEHEALAQPAQDPVAAEVGDQRQEGCEVGGGGEEREHPDEEEVIWHHGVDFGEPHALDSDAREDLLIGQRQKKLSWDRPLAVKGSEFVEDDEDGEGEGKEGGYYEGEEDLCVCMVSR